MSQVELVCISPFSGVPAVQAFYSSASFQHCTDPGHLLELTLGRMLTLQARSCLARISSSFLSRSSSTVGWGGMLPAGQLPRTAGVVARVEW